MCINFDFNLNEALTLTSYFSVHYFMLVYNMKISATIYPTFLSIVMHISEQALNEYVIAIIYNHHKQLPLQ